MTVYAERVAEELAQPGPHRVVCAVCATAYDDEPGAHRIRRCPSCGSRLIRQDDGRLGAVATAAPPPKLAENAQKRPRLSAGESAYLITLGVVLLMVASCLLLWSLQALVDVFDFRGLPSPFLVFRMVAFAAALVGGVACLRVAARRSSAANTGPARTCIACRYPLPWNHAGRCPECGKLQNPYDPRNHKCPGCRRTLRGFYGDACPECGADIRFVTDGVPPDEVKPD
jgi:rRNA maturation endonuclease Nob1